MLNQKPHPGPIPDENNKTTEVVDSVRCFYHKKHSLFVVTTIETSD